MSFGTVYERLCNFQSGVVNDAVAGNRNLLAPIRYPNSLATADMPIFINSFGRFARKFFADGVHEYRGSMTMTLYTEIAGVRDTLINQFDTVNWIDATVSQLERYQYLEISGVPESSLLEPVIVESIEPLSSNLRYPGNAAQLFWGGRITISVVIAIDKAC